MLYPYFEKKGNEINIARIRSTHIISLNLSNQITLIEIVFTSCL